MKYIKRFEDFISPSLPHIKNIRKNKLETIFKLSDKTINNN